MSYRDLKSYQSATIIYDFTVEFCDRYIDTYRSNKSYKTYRRTRMGEQMEQAARSGKQNIVEASNQRTSTKIELKLLGIARGSLQELLEDYEDFLRQKSLAHWARDSAQARAVRELAYRSNKSYGTYRSYLASPDMAANAVICLINQTNFLLDRQIKSLEEKFIKEGGWSEQMRKKREQVKKRQRYYIADHW